MSAAVATVPNEGVEGGREGEREVGWEGERERTQSLCETQCTPSLTRSLAP